MGHFHTKVITVRVLLNSHALPMLMTMTTVLDTELTWTWYQWYLPLTMLLWCAGVSAIMGTSASSFSENLSGQFCNDHVSVQVLNLMISSSSLGCLIGVILYTILG